MDKEKLSQLEDLLILLHNVDLTYAEQEAVSILLRFIKEQKNER